jgi:hypothetical protein
MQVPGRLGDGAPTDRDRYLDHRHSRKVDTNVRQNGVDTT